MSADGSGSEAVDQIAGEVNVNVVACESCRSKKCKCDRQLPRCTQCRKSRSHCTYPESYKRGFPQGYLTGLEKRLLETELALFETLYHTHSTGTQDESQRASAIMAERGHKQSKADKMQEWIQMPLRTHEERTAWLMQKADYASTLHETTVTPSSSTSIQQDISMTDADAEAQARDHEAAAGLLGINRSGSVFQDNTIHQSETTQSSNSTSRQWFAGSSPFSPSQSHSLHPQPTSHSLSPSHPQPQTPQLEPATYQQQYPTYAQQQQQQQQTPQKNQHEPILSPRSEKRGKRPADILIDSSTESRTGPGPGTGITTDPSSPTAEAQALSSSQAHKFF